MITTLNTRINLKNRQPIGILHAFEVSLISSSNPTGSIFLDMASNFESGMNAYIERAIDATLRAGAQGMILWDLCGKEFYNRVYPFDDSQVKTRQVGYIGSPDLAEQINPQWQGRTPAFFKPFHAAGLKTGCCLRVWDFDVVNRVWLEPADYFQSLLRKASYAYSKFGCTFFYVDTNVYFYGPERVLPATIFSRLRRALPRCQFFPELETLDYWRDFACYLELRNPNGAETGPPAPVLEAIPSAFGVNNLTGGDIDGNLEALRQRRGIDLWLMNTWWWNKDVERFARLVQSGQ